MPRTASPHIAGSHASSRKLSHLSVLLHPTEVDGPHLQYVIACALCVVRSHSHHVRGYDRYLDRLVDVLVRGNRRLRATVATSIHVALARAQVSRTERASERGGAADTTSLTSHSVQNSVNKRTLQLIESYALF